MKFVEITGATLREIVVHPDEIQEDDLHAAGVEDDTIVRVNEQGDVEVRRADRWDIIGGLLGDYKQRLKKATGLDWA